MTLKFGTTFFFISRPVKILKRLKTLLIIGIILHATVGCVRA